MKIPQNFVAFSEYMNFKNIQKISREIIGVRINKSFMVLACILKLNNFNNNIGEYTLLKKDWVT